jgi:hypothetical protein
MESLERLDAYMSHRLHWFPYEISRCRSLRESSVSTRSLYGNFKFRPSFPLLQPTTDSADSPDLDRLDPAARGIQSIAECSVCARPLSPAGLQQAWLSARVATDVLPLLVNACSRDCIDSLPPGAEGYVRTPHGGGPTIQQPPPYY